MMKAIIIHGWGGSPLGGWIPWIAKELRNRKITVITPQMPNTEFPRIEEWVPFLQDLMDEPQNTILIGHSIGCQTILRCVEKLEQKVKGILFVAGWLTLSEEIMTNLEEKEIAKPWVEMPVNLEKVSQNSRKIISIFSDDDPYVPLENWQHFKKLGEVIILDRKGHIEGTEPEILSSIQKLL